VRRSRRPSLPSFVLLRYVTLPLHLGWGGRKSNTGSGKQNKSKRDDRGINGLCDLSFCADWRLDKGKPWFRLRMVRGGVFDGCLQVKSHHDDGDAVYKEQSSGGAACIIDASLFP
jgi:hypothetical protein